MAKRLTIFVIAFAIPLIALLSHHELRRILMWDALILTFKAPSRAMELLPEPADPLYRGIKEAESFVGREQWLAYERLYRQTGEVWIGVFGLRYGMNVVLLGQEKSTQKRQDAESLLKLASELSEQDKDNAFPLLAKAYALFALGRDNEALSTFHKAALRQNYRTYDEKWLQVKAARVFTAEERLLRGMAIMFPHLSQLREMARRVMRWSANAEKESNFEQAFRLAEDVLKVGAKMREQGFWLIDALVGIAIQSIAFAGETRKLTLTEAQKFAQLPDGRVKQLKVLAERFAEFARKHGRNDLAEWALKEAEENARVFLLTRRYPYEDLLFGDIKHRDGLRLINNRLTGFSLLLSTLALAIVGLISAAFLWRIPIAIDKYSPISAALVVMGLPLAAVVWGILGAMKGEFWDFTRAQTYFGAIYLPFAILLLLFAICFLPALWQIRGKVNWQTVAVLIGIPAFAGALTIAAVNTPVFKAMSVLLSVLLFLALIALTIITFWLKGKLDAPNSLIRILSAVALAIMICVLLFVWLCFGAVLESLRWRPHEIEGMPLFLVPALTAAAFTFFIAWGVWARFGHHDYRHICQGALARLKGAAVLLLLICWWGYAVVEFSSLPLRTKLHRALDDLIAHGELGVIERVVGSTPR
ncbi:hypothetical protein GG496_001666 [Candidatus Fervidibacteria bacterium JGI MDM2 JNZ-1-D12]